MRSSRRVPAQWFQRGLWLIALVFALCLLGLGSLVIDDLPRVEQPLRRDDFLDQAEALPLRAARAQAQEAEHAAGDAHERATLQLQAAQKAYGNARDSFGNWLDTRKATNLPQQDAELTARTAALDALKAAQAFAQLGVDQQSEAEVGARQAGEAAQRRLDLLEASADRRMATAENGVELRVFLYRLLLTLPLLALAGWLWKTRRNGPWWPFTWGFIGFALFTFFVELVPYMPSYGGYVQYGVGLLVTVLAGRSIIVAMQAYLARQAVAEQQPDPLRRRALDYDVALARLAKGVCPGCERPVDVKDAATDYCPHCGIGLFNRCGHCETRKNAFAPFCHACGTPAGSAIEAQAA